MAAVSALPQGMMIEMNQRESLLLKDAVQEIVQQKLVLNGGGLMTLSISAPYGAYDEKGEKLERWGSRFNPEMSELRNPELGKAVMRYLKEVEKRINLNNGEKFFKPLYEAQKVWENEEVASGKLGHFSSPHFTPQVEWKELSPELQARVPYFAQVMRIALCFARVHKTTIRNFYTDEPSQYQGRAEDNGGILYCEGMTFCTPWGEMKLIGKGDLALFQQLAAQFKMECVRFYGNPIYTLTLDADGKPLPKTDLQYPLTMYLDEKVCKDRWESIRDHVFVKACK